MYKPSRSIKITYMLNPNAPLPDDVYDRLPGRIPVLDQSIPVDAARWHEALTARDLPIPVGKLAGSGSGQIALSRADVFAVANQEPTPAGALQLLWNSLAWGLGLRAPRLHARLDAIAHDPDRASELLAEAWRSVRDAGDPETDYAILTTPHGAGRIKWLGPAFSTKFLYFAHGPDATPTHLILDRVVATKLQVTAWPAAPTTGWWPSTYGAYCALMHHWAAEASDRSGRDVSPDEIEFTVFKG